MTVSLMGNKGTWDFLYKYLKLFLHECEWTKFDPGFINGRRGGGSRVEVQGRG